MRKLLVGLVFAALAVGCYAHGRIGVRGRYNPVADLITAVAVTAIVVAASTPPPVVQVTHVEYHDYGARPGQIWVNGRYTYVNNAWVWNAGFWQQERQGHYWVQGAWQPQGNQYVWVEGQWAAPRDNHIYVDGYWDYRDTGYVWTAGYWETDRPGHVYVSGSYTVVGNRRSYARGRWEVDDGRPEYTTYRTRYHRTHSSTHHRGGGGPVIRDHR